MIADLYTRERSFGGSLPYTDLSDDEGRLALALRDVSPMLAGAVAVALVLMAVGIAATRRSGVRSRCSASASRSPTPGVIHLPNYYARMVFYVPVAAAPFVAAVAVRLRPTLLP